MRTARTASGEPSAEPKTSGGAEQPAAAARHAEEEALEEVPFPRYQIALVQDESEMLLQPQYDLFGTLSDEKEAWWEVDLYTERTFEALLRGDRQFDCIVIGLNAAWKSSAIRDALSARLPNTGLFVLHQRERGAVPFLTDELGVDIEPFEDPVARVVIAEKRERKDEILLGYPERIDLDPDVDGRPATRLPSGEAYCGLTRAPTSRWRTVLEVYDGQRRVPVLLRTPSGREPAVVVCTVLLQPRHEQHLKLLRNLLMWCVSGRPEAVVVAGPRSAREARLVHRKLRMQGMKAITTPVAGVEQLDFQEWPLRGIADVVLPEDVDPTAASTWRADDPAGVRAWLRGGGRIIRLGPGERMTVIHGESDAHWVTRRWAVWFLAEPAATWHGGHAHGEKHRGSLIATRAVLRFLGALYSDDESVLSTQPGSLAVRHVVRTLREEGSEIEPKRFGLQPPSDFFEPVAALLRRRHPPSRDRYQHLDYSVSTTCAVLDIDALLGGGAFNAGTSKALQAWLRRESKTTGLEERLEIVRCLADEELLSETLTSLRQRLGSTRPITASLETKVREAVVACRATPGDVEWPDASHPSVVESGLRLSTLLSASYLVALGDLEASWRSDALGHSLLTPDPRVVDRAVISIGRHGSPLMMMEEDDEGRAPHEMLSTSALALFAYFGRDARPTHVIRGDSEALPPGLLTTLLVESERLREENAEVASQAKTIRRASALLGAIALVPLVGLGVLVWWLAGVIDEDSFLTRWGVIVAFVGTAIVGMDRLLDRLRLRPPWWSLIVAAVDGLGGLRNRWRRPAADTSAQNDAR
jgi:hypothetical protein